MAPTATAVPGSRSATPRERDTSTLRKKGQPPTPTPGQSPPPHTSAAALGILRALDPFAALDVPVEKEGKHHKHEHGHISDETLEEKKEKKGFWSSGREKDREKEKEKERGREKRDEDGTAELTRMIGASNAFLA